MLSTGRWPAAKTVERKKERKKKAPGPQQPRRGQGIGVENIAHEFQPERSAWNSRYSPSLQSPNLYISSSLLCKAPSVPERWSLSQIARCLTLTLNDEFKGTSTLGGIDRHGQHRHICTPYSSLIFFPKPNGKYPHKEDLMDNKADENSPLLVSWGSLTLYHCLFFPLFTKNPCLYHTIATRAIPHCLPII